MPDTTPARQRPCLIHSVAAALAREAGLEAISFDRARKSINVATVGHVSDSTLSEQLADTIEEAQSESASNECGLLTGNFECGKHCGSLAAKERSSVTVKYDGDQITIARLTCPTAPNLWRWRRLPWPKVVQRDVEFIEAEEHAEDWRWQMVAASLCAVFAIAGWWLTRATPHGVLPPLPALACYALAYLAGAWFAAEEVWERLRQYTLDVHFLMLAVAAGSALVNEWNEGAILLFLFSFSGALEHFALFRTRREISSLFKNAPKTATLLDAAGHEKEVPVAELRRGMRLLVKPGAQFPVDAEVVKGATAADESNLTGEASPVEKAIGDTVLAGTINLWGAIEAVVTKPVSQSALQKIIRLIQDAQQQKAPAQRVIDRFSSAYAYGILGLTIAMFFVWWLGFKLPPFTSTAEQESAFYRAMTLLVVSSPCALVLSIPSAVLAAIAWGASHGVLFRGGAAVEKLAHAEIVALDKTGTLTTGELRVEQMQSFPPGREQEVAQLAFSLERLSTHPLARAITRHGKHLQLTPVEFEHFESIAGQGLRARRGGQECYLGRREPLERGPHAAVLAKVPHTEAGFSEVWLSTDHLLGRVLLRDDIRPQARTVLENMRAAGLRTVVLTGDRRATAEHLKSQLPVDDVRAELHPEDKVAAIRKLSEGGQHVVMVGDGVNDAPSLAAAHVGVAMGARGSDAALEQAEVVLMHDRLENFLAAFHLSQRARRIIRQNQFISLGTVVMLVGFALAGGIPLTVGVVGHEGSTVIVVMNSLRLLLGRSSAAVAPALVKESAT
ncbi:MAG: cadmium-translocating P-type ATPase [Verrucomicrobia bacterium]|nr:cadmium-translocating P-type ATPase [Verrucomicrobiota bacterium]